MNNDVFKNIVKNTYNFEDEEDYEDYEEQVECQNCGEIVPEDYGKLTEWDGFICEQCLINGYGK